MGSHIFGAAAEDVGGESGNTGLNLDYVEKQESSRKGVRCLIEIEKVRTRRCSGRGGHDGFSRYKGSPGRLAAELWRSYARLPQRRNNRGREARFCLASDPGRAHSNELEVRFAGTACARLTGPEGRCVAAPSLSLVGCAQPGSVAPTDAPKRVFFACTGSVPITYKRLGSNPACFG